VEPEPVVLDPPEMPDVEGALDVLAGAWVVDDWEFGPLLLQPLRPAVHKAIPSTAEAPYAPLRMFTR